MLKDQDGKILLKFAQAYGFRNIQNVMRKIKQGKCDYDFVELMACPSGCLNGGGQIKLKEINTYFSEQGKEELKENSDLLANVTNIYHGQNL